MFEWALPVPGAAPVALAKLATTPLDEARPNAGTFVLEELLLEEEAPLPDAAPPVA